MQLVNHLEGIRCGLDVFARLANTFREESVSLIWTQDQLKDLCKTWEFAAKVASNFSHDNSDQVPNE